MKVVYFNPGDDLKDAFWVREKVFVQEQGFSLELEIDDTDPIARHVVLYDEDRPVATGRVFPHGEEEGLYVAGRIAVLAQQRGKGLGAVIMGHLEDLAQQAGATAMTLGAQCRAQEFYRKLGYRPWGEEYYDEYCPHIPMKKEL